GQVFNAMSEAMHELAPVRMSWDGGVILRSYRQGVALLRSALAGQLASRPYRLTMPVHVDVNEVLRHLRTGQVRAAVAAYGGDLLPGTESPALAELGDVVAVAVREALLADPAALERHLAWIDEPTSRPRGTPDAALASALLKLDDELPLDQLDTRETYAVLAAPNVLTRLAARR
ncbi:MAG: hypothetical protein ACLGI6_23760, partial [Gammaproteobacteria bacterium]